MQISVRPNTSVKCAIFIRFTLYMVILNAPNAITKLNAAKGWPKMPEARKSVGIYSGTFDPVHTGHVAFALEAAQVANLQKVVFLPEETPREKTPTSF